VNPAKPLADDEGVAFYFLDDDIGTAVLCLQDVRLPHDASRLDAEYWRCKDWLHAQFRVLKELGAAEPPDGLTEAEYRAFLDEKFGPLPTDTLDEVRLMLIGSAVLLLRHVEELIGTVKAMTPRLNPQGTIAITVDEANTVAMKLAKQDSEFVKGGVRKWAAAIQTATGKTCSVSTVQATRLWTETMKTTGRGKIKGGKPRAVAFSEKVEAVVGKGGRHEALNSLIAQQQADDEPSPLDDSPSKEVRQRKRV
jgi:hypothetical protein